MGKNYCSKWLDGGNQKKRGAVCARGKKEKTRPGNKGNSVGFGEIMGGVVAGAQSRLTKK